MLFIMIIIFIIKLDENHFDSFRTITHNQKIYVELNIACVICLELSNVNKS